MILKPEHLSLFILSLLGYLWYFSFNFQIDSEVKSEIHTKIQNHYRKYQSSTDGKPQCDIDFRNLTKRIDLTDYSDIF